MKIESIKAHLAPYSIAEKRKTTINHAFASAIAPVDAYDKVRLSAALRHLGQNPDGDLHCVYCGELANTWDHLVGLVKDGKLRGYGHQIGNLVPSCRACNSEKGAKEWETYLRKKVLDSAFEAKHRQITFYLTGHAARVNLKQAEEQNPDEWKRYDEIKKKICSLMKEADTIAEKLRPLVALKQEE